MRRLVLAFVAAILWAVALPAGAAVTPSPNPAPSESLISWLVTEAPGVVVASETSSLTAEERTRVVVGGPIQVWEWDTAFAQGRHGADPLQVTDQWVAPLSLDGTGVGALVISVDGAGAVADHREAWDAELGGALLSVPAASFLYDEDVDGWFRLAGEILTPITASAQGILAGSLPVDDYQPYLSARSQPTTAPVTVEEDEPGGIQPPVIVAAAIVFGLLAMALTNVWARRPIPEEDE